MDTQFPAPHETLSPKHLILGALVGLIVLGAGMSLGMQIGANATPLDTGEEKYQSGYDAGFASARTLVENSKLGDFFKTPDDVRSLSGVVTAIEGNRISFKVQSTNPFEDQTLIERVVMVSDTTKVTKFVQTTPSIEEQTKFQEFLKEANPNTTDEEIKQFISQQLKPFTQQDSTISDVSVGDSISVVAGENINTTKEFVVVQLQIQGSQTTSN